MKQEDINEINENCPSDQGIFVEPSMIPIHIKEPVVYCRYKTGGVEGGSCWESSNPEPFTLEPPADRFKVLDMVLAKLKPNITYLQFKQIEEMVHSNAERQYEYYGNSSDWKVEYIILSELEEFLNTLP